MRQEIAFNAEGVTLRGWLYLPDRATGPCPRSSWRMAFLR